MTFSLVHRCKLTMRGRGPASSAVLLLSACSLLHEGCAKLLDDLLHGAINSMIRYSCVS